MGWKCEINTQPHGGERRETMRMPTKNEALEFAGCLSVVLFIIALQFI
jgi:hypothetical protein